MTELLFHQDSYLKEFEATVQEVVEKGVVLDRTGFYIGGGGQPADTGELVQVSGEGRVYQVSRVGRAEGIIVHQIQGDFKQGDFPEPGVQVRGRIDWENRYTLMRTHTALHILCGVVWRDYGAHVTGGDMRPGEARMDFELEQMTSQFAQEIEEKINLEVAAARDVLSAVISREQADQTPDLIRTKINLLPANIQEVRTIDITGLDLQADGGTHVGNTREVGEIRVVGHESKGRINKRLRISLAGK
jgi:misacylated tRNA(Ala) deacylase